MGKQEQPMNNEPLRRAIRRMYRENTRDSQVGALEELARAQLLAPVVVEQREGKDNIQFMLLPTQDGRDFLPAFTRLEELRKGFDDPNQQTLVLPFAHCANMILRDNSAVGLVVDPFGDSLTLGRELVEYTVGAMGVLQARMQLRRPEPWPEELARAVSNQAALLAQVKRVWLTMARDAGGMESYLLLVDHSGQPEQVFQSLAQAARPWLKEMRADVAAYDRRYDEVLKNMEPVFDRTT